MGGVRKEKGVLKLVRRGGVVDIHSHPLTAAQVMELYPRHCVTRPDVFKYPWIVVRPESVLNLGRVFYVVPSHTIRRLLQLYGFVKGSKTGNYDKLSKADDYDDECAGYVLDSVETISKNAYLLLQPVIEPSSFRKFTRVSPENIADDQIHVERCQRRLNDKYSDGYLLFEETFLANQNNEPILNKKHQKKKNPVDNPLVRIEYKNPKQKVRPQPKVGSLVEERASCQRIEYDSDNNAQSCFAMRKNTGNLEPMKSRTTLKPCLKKYTTKNTSRYPRVTFMFQEDDHNRGL